MAQKRRPGVNSVGGHGSRGQNMPPKVVGELTRLGLADTLASVGGPEHNRAVLANSPKLPLAPGTRNLGLRPEQTAESFGYLGDADRAQRRKAARQALDLSATDQHLLAVYSQGLDSIFHLFFYSQTSGHTQPAIERLEDHRRRLPWEIRMGDTVLPHEPPLRAAVADNPTLPAELVERGLLTVSVLTDNRSAIVQRYSRGYQDELLANAYAGLMGSIWCFQNMRSPADVAKLSARYQPLVGLSFGVAHTISDPAGGVWKPFKTLFGWELRGSGHLENILLQLQQAITTALTDPSWRAIDEDINPQMMAVVVLHVPLRRTDPRWRTIVAEIEHWLDLTYPFVLPLWVVGNGKALPDLATLSPFWVQASCFFPMPALPRAVQAILDQPALLRRGPEATSDNGKAVITPDLQAVSIRQQ